jgi:prophage regulatory protein
MSARDLTDFAPAIEEYRLIRLEEVIKMTSLGKTKIYELIKQRRFPPARKIDDASRWVASEVANWIRSL